MPDSKPLEDLSVATVSHDDGDLQSPRHMQLGCRRVALDSYRRNPQPTQFCTEPNANLAHPHDDDVSRTWWPAATEESKESGLKQPVDQARGKHRRESNSD